MVKAVSAYQHGHTRVYTNDDGSTTVQTDGSPAWRNNNPGNIKYGPNAKLAGAIGKDDGGFAIFPDYQSGLQGMLNVLTREYGRLTIDEMIKKYAPPEENRTAEYATFLKKQVGPPGDRVINDLSLDEFNRLARAIHTWEGWTPGTTTGAYVNMGAPGSTVIAQRARNVQANPFPEEGAPVPHLAETQAVRPAFAATGATSWPPHYTPPNVLPPEAARRFSSPPHAGPVPYVDQTQKAQQALDHWLPAPDDTPRDFSDRYGRWDNSGGVSKPATSGAYGGVGRTGDHADLGAANPQFAQSGVGSSNSFPPTQASQGAAALPAAYYNRDPSSFRGPGSPMPDSVPFANSPGSLATPSDEAIAAAPWYSPAQSQVDAMLAAARNRGPGNWTMSLLDRQPTSPSTAPADSFENSSSPVLRYLAKYWQSAASNSQDAGSRGPQSVTASPSPQNDELNDPYRNDPAWLLQLRR